MAKFADEANKLNESLSALFNRGIRSALLAGLLAATKFTHHDSSNAAAHWMLAGADGRRSRPWQRKLGTVQDLRGTKGVRGDARAPVRPVGYRHDGGTNKAATQSFVRQRELEEVLSKLVSGRSPETRFYFYNAVGSKTESEDGTPPYAESANIDEAGQAAIARTYEIAERHITAGNVRKGAL